MCAFWPQIQTVSVDQLEADLAQELAAKNIKQVKFDKGLWALTYASAHRKNPDRLYTE